MKTAIVKQFNDQQVEFLSDGKELFITAESLGNALGYVNPRVAIVKIYNRHKDLLNEFCSDTILVSEAGKRKALLFNETGCNIIAMKANTPKAKEFIKWAARIITDYRHGRLQKRLPAASLIREMSKILPEISLKIFLRDTLNIPLTPKEILEYYLKKSSVDIDILIKSWGYKNQAHFFFEINTGTTQYKEKLAAMAGLNVTDIWPN